MIRSILGATVCLMVLAGSAYAQQPALFSASGLKMERAELEELLRYNEEASSNTSTYSGSTKDKARRDAAAIRDRLTNGDFELGDRILLQIQGEDSIPDSVIVENGPKITIPKMGEISLAGVLRSELETHLTKELGRYLTRPQVRAVALIRTGIMGSVGSPGYYTLPADMLLTEAVMFAGGPGAGSDMEKIRIERTGRVLWEGDELQEVLADGRTLDQLNLRAGDQIFVPAVPPGGSKLMQAAKWGLPIVASLVFGVTIFR
jgi:protein involved in polysaccharide export with SLBB domain